MNWILEKPNLYVSHWPLKWIQKLKGRQHRITCVATDESLCIQYKSTLLLSWSCHNCCRISISFQKLLLSFKIALWLLWFMTDCPYSGGKCNSKSQIISFLVRARRGFISPTITSFVDADMVHATMLLFYQRSYMSGSYMNGSLCVILFHFWRKRSLFRNIYHYNSYFCMYLCYFLKWHQ